MKYVYLILFVLIFWTGKSASDIAECPDAFQENKYWTKRYNMRPLTGHNIDTVSVTIHKNHFIIVDGKKVISNHHPFSQSMMIYPANYSSGFRRYEHDILYNFYAGDTVTFYELNAKTGNMDVTKLGFHSNVYFKAIEKGNWRALEVEKHADEKTAVFGITMFVNKEDIGKRSHSRGENAQREDLLRDYPRYYETILSFTKETKTNYS